MAFYIIEKQRCKCGKVATHGVYQSGTDHRGDYCSACAKRRAAELTKAYAPKVEPPRVE